jgi:hypothetical protein
VTCLFYLSGAFPRNTPLANKLLMKEISPSAKLEYKTQKKYNEKPLWLDKHFYTISKYIRLFIFIIWMSVVLYLLSTYYIPLTKGNSTTENVIFTIIAFFIAVLMIPIVKLTNNFEYNIRLYSKKQKNLALQKLKVKITKEGSYTLSCVIG